MSSLPLPRASVLGEMGLDALRKDAYALFDAAVALHPMDQDILVNLWQAAQSLRKEGGLEHRMGSAAAAEDALHADGAGKAPAVRVDEARRLRIVRRRHLGDDLMTEYAFTGADIKGISEIRKSVGHHRKEVIVRLAVSKVIARIPLIPECVRHI